MIQCSIFKRNLYEYICTIVDLTLLYEKVDECVRISGRQNQTAESNRAERNELVHLNLCVMCVFVWLSMRQIRIDGYCTNLQNYLLLYFFTIFQAILGHSFQIIPSIIGQKYSTILPGHPFLISRFYLLFDATIQIWHYAYKIGNRSSNEIS